MAKIQVSYDASQEIEQLIKGIEENIDMNKKDDNTIYDIAQKIIQSAFDEGRRFQKQISIGSSTKDGICFKADIG